MRIGIGYDVHRLVEGRRLVLGGVRIPFEKGLLGYSDADVLIHALMDAMLGAAGLDDIGVHFPDADPKYKDACSLELLCTVREMCGKKGLALVNADCVVIAQAPKLSGYFAEMRRNIAEALRIPYGDINIKATTEEGLGFTGAGEGIAAKAVCLLDGASK